MTPEEFFDGNPLGWSAYERVSSLLRALGDFEVRVSKSQVAFRRSRGFAYLWLPGRYLAHPQAPVVLSFALGREDRSARFKQVSHPSPKHWMHHVEIHDPDDLDDEVATWLREAYDRAG